jgi:hypothetical protein
LGGISVDDTGEGKAYFVDVKTDTGSYAVKNVLRQMISQTKVKAVKALNMTFRRVQFRGQRKAPQPQNARLRSGGESERHRGKSSDIMLREAGRAVMRMKEWRKKRGGGSQSIIKVIWTGSRD